jgi:hypothetical protein
MIESTNQHQFRPHIQWQVPNLDTQWNLLVLNVKIESDTTSANNWSWWATQNQKESRCRISKLWLFAWVDDIERPREGRLKLGVLRSVVTEDGGDAGAFPAESYSVDERRDEMEKKQRKWYPFRHSLFVTFTTFVRCHNREQWFHRSGFSLGRIIFAAGIVAALLVPTESQSESLGRLPAES